ncbi:TetR/AcrR family transcriptional regulator [Ferrimonas pelagia]|uniref:HTH tetR-type domain-containing protein n=1 Tax=Ferrimonas pelagia TaxID=1177826 RepID=A0ABP9EFH9_9GAMM
MAKVIANPRKTNMLNQASSLITDFGVTKFKFTEVAKRAHCSYATLYDEFPSKEELIAEISIKNISASLLAIKYIDGSTELDPIDKLICLYYSDLVRTHHFPEELIWLNFIVNQTSFLENISDFQERALSMQFQELREFFISTWKVCLSGSSDVTSDDIILQKHKKLSALQRGIILLSSNGRVKRNGLHFSDQDSFTFIVDEIINSCHLKKNKIKTQEQYTQIILDIQNEVAKQFS